MRRLLATLVLLAVLAAGQVATLWWAAGARQALPLPEDHGYVLPGPLLRVVAGEFRGLAADFCFLQGLTAYGKLLESAGPSQARDSDWQRVYRLLDAATDLDPYFFDPYYFGNAVLSRNPEMIPRINQLLEKGLEWRDWDWLLPFYLGFNHFYYLQDSGRAAEYLMLGAQRPDAMPLLATLAARLAYQENRTENAIVFLRGILSRTEDERTRELYQVRLEALEKIHYLEQAVLVYRQHYGEMPGTLKVLQERGVISAIPEDPYGGTFYLDADGSVKSTSELTYAKGGTSKEIPAN